MSWTHPTYEAVIRLLGERTGLSFPAQRHDSAEQGIRRAMTHAGVADLDRYRTLLESDDDALDHLIVELTIGETYFFREPAQFEFIRGEVLPELQRRRGHEHGIRAWSAACASGEEAYSLAIVFKEAGLAGQAYLLATDISREALAKAHRAIYSNWSLRGEGATRATPYLSKRGNLHELADGIRRSVTFEYLNLALDVSPSFVTGAWGMDLILCRNVLIYFDRDTVRKVARRLYESLAPGGWLLTASSDPPLGEDASFETVVTDVGVFYRRPFSLDKETGFRQGDKETTEGEAKGDIIPQREPASVSLSPCLPDSLSPTASTRKAESNPHEEAQEAFARGDYGRAAELTRSLTQDVLSGILHVRALANLKTSQAEHACAEAAARHPLSAEVHYLHAVLLLELGRDEEAARAARRVVYLDRSLAIGHFTLGSILRHHGDLAGARRAYRNAHDLCLGRPSDEIVPLSDGEQAGRLARAAAAQLAILDSSREVSS